ncbi:MAG: NfeD family protein [Planctomycetaceae bacterium]
MDSYALMAILTLALGLALLVAEVFIPSGGVIMAAAGIVFVISVWSAWTAWGKSGELTQFLIYIGALVVLFPSVLGGAFYAFPRTEYGRRLISPPSLDEMQPFVAETERLSRLIGKTGTTLTRLSPGGMVLVEGSRLHAESEGMLILTDTPVRVLALRGNRVLVRQVRESSTPDPLPASEPQVEHERTPLDDDFGQS